jgi:metal-sulfur cluster biosynthetic enzyme
MNDPDILDALKDVLDPEVGISIVDFGLVYRAAVTPAGIEVTLGVASTCPAMDDMVARTRTALRRRFPDTPAIRVELDTSRPWCPERLTDEGRLALGWVDPPTPPAEASSRRRAPTVPRATTIMPKMSRRWKN